MDGEGALAVSGDEMEDFIGGFGSAEGSLTSPI